MWPLLEAVLHELLLVRAGLDQQQGADDAEGLQQVVDVQLARTADHIRLLQTLQQLKITYRQNAQKWCSMLWQIWKSKLRQTLHVLKANDPQKIQSSDWLWLAQMTFTWIMTLHNILLFIGPNVISCGPTNELSKCEWMPQHALAPV